jgi:thiamine biosynthesis lipoprotein
MDTMVRTPPGRRAWVEQVMGMPMSIHLRGADVDGPRAAAAVADAYGVLREMDATFSTYRTESELMRLRREELPIEEASARMREALAIGEEAERVTGGAFTTMLPTPEGDLAFDPTGLVKGWAVDLAGAPLAELPGISFCINAGGDLLVGAHAEMPLEGPGSIVWRVGIEDPSDRSRVASVHTLTHGAVATSGTAARGAHLYDPATGRHVDRGGSVTVVGPDLLWADIWATALFVGGAAARDAFVASAPDHLSTEL